MQSLSDQELLRLYQSEKNNQWLGLLLERYTLILLGVCMKYLRNEEEAKDMVQQVFEKTIREIDRFEISNFGAWMYRIAINECLMLLRKKSGKTTEIQEPIIALEQDSVAELESEKEKDRIRIHQLLEDLSTEQRNCIKYFFFDKKSYRQIAEITGYTINEVKSYLQNGKRNLKKMLITQNKS